MSIAEMLKFLIKEGLSQEAIAERIGVKQPTVSRMLKGANTSWSRGEAIKKLHAEVLALPNKTH